MAWWVLSSGKNKKAATVQRGCHGWVLVLASQALTSSRTTPPAQIHPLASTCAAAQLHNPESRAALQALGLRYDSSSECGAGLGDLCIPELVVAYGGW